MLFSLLLLFVVVELCGGRGEGLYCCCSYCGCVVAILLLLLLFLYCFWLACCVGVGVIIIWWCNVVVVRVNTVSLVYKLVL